MWSYIARRMLIAIPLLFIVLTVVFLMVRVAPGDPARVILGSYASQEAVDALRAKMGLDKPLYLQYLDYLSGLARGDLGRSMVSGAPVATQLAAALPYTVELTLSGIIFGVIIGVPLGVYTALRRNKLADYVGRTVSLLGLSFPSFYLGILLMLLLAVQVKLFPVIGGGDLHNLMDNLYHLFLPALTLGLIMASYVTRMTRSAMLNVLNEEYVKTARAKGLRERRVIYKHVLRNALIPIASLVGLYSVVLMGGSVTVEIVYSRPGLGKLMIGSILQRDYITAQGVITLYGGLVVLINLLSDLTYGAIDPRIKYQ